VTNETALNTILKTNGDAPLPRKVDTRIILPSTWIIRAAKIEYVGAAGEPQETAAACLDWCGMGPEFNLGGAITVVGWDRLALCELVED
jgi:hypothetical protein